MPHRTHSKYTPPTGIPERTYSAITFSNAVTIFAPATRFLFHEKPSPLGSSAALISAKIVGKIIACANATPSFWNIGCRWSCKTESLVRKRVMLQHL